MDTAVTRVTSFGPVVLVPAAWLVVLMTVNGATGQQPLFIAHLVMLGFLLLFLGVGWSRMEEGLLQARRAIIVVGVLATAAGAAGLAGFRPTSLFLGASLVYWMVKPGLGLVYTGVEMERNGIYLWGGCCCPPRCLYRPGFDRRSHRCDGCRAVAGWWRPVGRDELHDRTA